MYTHRSMLTKHVRACLKLSEQQQQKPQRTGAYILWRQLQQLDGAFAATVTASPAVSCTAAMQSNSFRPFATASNIGHSSKTTCRTQYIVPPTVRPVPSTAGAPLRRSALASPPVLTTLSASRYRAYSKFTAAREPPHALSALPLNEDRAIDLISNLKDSERAAIKAALEKYDAVKVKKGFEGKLAAQQWRTRFGRPTKVPALGEVDATGSFCAFPDNWLKQKMAEKAIHPQSSDLWKIFFVNAVPFVAFGFLDNFVMIVAGDYIEIGLGSVMCVSTMAAAGLGNTVSDVLGIGSAFYVERACDAMGLRPPDLTPIQMEMKSSRRSANWGRILGIVVGCVLGMFPLLLMGKKPTPTEETTEQQKIVKNSP